MSVATEDHDTVRLMTLDRPERRNAFNYEMYHSLAEALSQAAASRQVHVVVLTGAGAVFSSGQDLDEMTAIVEGRARVGTEAGFRELLDAVESFELPLVAAVNGAGVGLGFTLLAHCDLVLMSDEARLKVPFAQLGVPPEAGASYLLPARMGWQRAAHALFTGGWVSAADAVESGLAWRRCPAEDLLPLALATATEIASCPPDAVREIKRLMVAARLPGVRAARNREEAAFAELFGRTVRRIEGDAK